MNHKALILAFATISTPLIAATDNKPLQREIQRLQEQTKALQMQLNQLQQKLVVEPTTSKSKTSTKKPSGKSEDADQSVAVLQNSKQGKAAFHSSVLTVHTLDKHPESNAFYPTALIADGRVITHIAGTPVVTSPYTGERPAFDGSDYIVNISSINRDIRLMQQRRTLYHAYQTIGYPFPNIPIIAISGKSEPAAFSQRPYLGQSSGDITLGSSELDVAAILNPTVEAFMSIAYDESPPLLGGPRVSNSSFDLNLGFVNIGNLDKSPFYFTAGQLYAPYGRYSSSMINSPLTLNMARTKTRPIIFGYKSQGEKGPYAAAYAFSSEVTRGHSAVGGINLGYIFSNDSMSSDIGVGYIGSLTDSQGMQRTGSPPFTTFGGFSSVSSGSENIRKVPGLDVHANVSFDRYSLTAEWVGASKAFRPQDLSFDGRGAKPQAAQLEGGVTFMAFNRPSSIGIGYQWSKDTLALNLPEHRLSGVFNISIWKNTVESIEYQHDMDFSAGSYANGAAPPGRVNANTLGTGQSSDTVIAQIGVYF